MTQEQQQKLEQAAFEAARSTEQRDKPINTAIERSHAVKWFKAGAQTILDNPSEWDLIKWEDYLKYNQHFQSQLSRYREALERIANANVILYDVFARNVAKEALKQQDNE